MLTKYHAKMGYEVSVIASLYNFNEKGVGVITGEPRTYYNTDGVKVIRLAYKKPFFWGKTLRKYKGTKEAIEKESPDIIFSHNLQFGDTGVVVKYLKKRPKVILYADNHGDFINSARNWISKNIKHRLVWKYFIKKIEPYIKTIYGVTPVRCRFLREIYHINPAIIDYLPLGVDDDAIPENKDMIRKSVREELAIDDNQVLIMTGGKLELRKNIHFLFEAFKKISDKNLHLVVCGTFTPEVSFLEDKMRRDNRIHLMGWCSSERVMNIMLASDFVCFPGTHSTLWEQAVGLGLPAIFKYWKEMDHVNVNNNCILVKGEDVDEIVSAIRVMAEKKNYLQYKSLAVEASSSFLYSNISKKAIGLI